MKSALPLMLAVLCCACASGPYAMIDGTRLSYPLILYRQARKGLDGQYYSTRSRCTPSSKESSAKNSTLSRCCRWPLQPWESPMRLACRYTPSVMRWPRPRHPGQARGEAGGPVAVQPPPERLGVVRLVG